MNRRETLKAGLFGTTALGAMALVGPPSFPVNASTSDLPPQDPSKLTITDVRVILTAPADIRLVVVKVLTNEPELYGLGCVTFTQRARLVSEAVDKYLKPIVIGRDPLRIEDLWQSSYVSSYWRNGPVLNNALSGLDMALWDILGKRAGMPVYQLLGGKCREAVDTYRHARGANPAQVEESVRGYVEQGYRHVRVQMSIPGVSAYGVSPRPSAERDAATTWEPAPYVRAIPRLFEHLRTKLGDEVELLHDIHERVPPIMAIRLVKDLEPFRPYFVEDPFSPEDLGYFRQLRQQTSVPLAMGELFNNPNEWVPLIKNQFIDFIRVHLSQVGGLSAGRKIAALCEPFGIRTAWHGPGDVSPVGHAANVHLDLAMPNFGIQEARDFTQAERDVFPGCPELKDGYYHANEQPGLGIDINEDLAAKFPIRDDPPFDLSWGRFRRRDGSIVKP
jgi:mannonate dehydratase